jgi:light-regulated signal transduction histidine kinase (bacteriophytochrome)
MIQLLQNLFVNGMKFQKNKPPEIHLSVREGPGEWVFACKDNGIGIDPRYFERIFMIFQRLHHREEYDGMGMGLAICKRIVERHGGRIWLESTPGEGSTFFFAIPKRES